MHSGSVLLTNVCSDALLIFTFVATVERWPGGMRLVKGVVGLDNMRPNVPWAGPLFSWMREDQESFFCPIWLSGNFEWHISFHIRCKCSVDFLMIVSIKIIKSLLISSSVKAHLSATSYQSLSKGFKRGGTHMLLELLTLVALPCL